MTAPVLDPTRSAPSVRRAQPTSPPPARPHLRVLPADQKRKEADRRRLVRQIAAISAVVAALCVFGVVVFHVVLTQNQFRLDRLRSQASTRQAEYDRLRLRVAQLESPDRVVAEAQQRLGMVTPPRITYLTPSVDEPSALGEPTPPADSRTALGSDWSTMKPHLAGG
ncbi:MAG: hypothetical protein ABIS21_01520 [Acidimicrobiales bacterium]